MEFDVFLCHNSSDKEAVKKIGEQLRCQLSAEAEPLMRRLDAVIQVLSNSLSGVRLNNHFLKPP